MSIQNYIWVEKYRPKSLDEIIISQDLKNKFLKFKNDKQIPNILLSGVQGIGKTSLAKIIVRELELEYLYINASDENGIETIRTKVKSFAETKSFNGNIKVIILDEADGVSGEFQKALRNVIETYSETCRFILTCNYKHKIVPEIHSRLIPYNLVPSMEQIVERILFILQNENIDAKGQGKLLKKVIETHFPDIRKIIQIVQDSVVDGKLDIKNINLDIDREFLKDIFNNLKDKEKDIFQVRKYLIDNEAKFNKDYHNLMKNMIEELEFEEFNNLQKRKILLELSEGMYRVSSVVDQEINCFSTLIKISQSI